MKKSHQGLKKENSASFLLGSLSQTPARDLENAFPWATENRAIIQLSARCTNLSYWLMW